MGPLPLIKKKKKAFKLYVTNYIGTEMDILILNIICIKCIPLPQSSSWASESIMSKTQSPLYLMEKIVWLEPRTLGLQSTRAQPKDGQGLAQGHTAGCQLPRAEKSPPGGA